MQGKKAARPMIAYFWLAVLAGGGAIGSNWYSASVRAQDTPLSSEAGESLATFLEPRLKGHRGQVALAIEHLKTGVVFHYRADQPMPTASLIKFPIMVAAYRAADKGELDLEQMLELRKEDQVPGSGVLTPHFSAGTRLSVRDAIHLMITFSDNTATNLVLNQIGLKEVGKALADLGLKETRIHSLVYRGDTTVDPNGSKRFGLGRTTAAETVRLYRLLHQGKLASAESTQAMLEHLKACQDRSKLARGLPSSVPLAHKSGAIGSVRTDAGIVFSPQGPLAICVLTAENEDQSWEESNAAERLCGDLARITYRYFNRSETADSSQPRWLAKGATGQLVETLQRSLNARLKPAPNLAVDGDFGPATERAVKALQTQRGLEATGRVERKTWQALEPLVTGEPPVPSPAEINGREFPREPPLADSDPPAVTCRAWALIDRDSGNLVGGHRHQEPLAMASTTKIMTCLLVCTLAQQDPKILDETIVFSTRADKTPGSTAGIRAGERVRARDLLFGLMLPSGNDASVALAEHFGDRFPRGSASGNGEQPELVSREADNYARFIAAMNAQAATLKLANSHFANPHGLSADGHAATAQDLARLARAALEHPLFREIVNTREYGIQVEGNSGYRRNLHLVNTNRLLRIEGYEGVKTGTTRAAGACLVSTAARNGRRLILVVLGASSSDTRYTDSRNLYRWAWQLPAPSGGPERGD